MRFILVLCIFLEASAMARQLTWEVHPVSPKCSAGIFCVKDEVVPQIGKAGVIDELIKMAERAKAKGGRLTMAFMSFTEPTLFEAICGLTKAGLPLEGYFDSKAGPPKGLGYRLESECQDSAGNNVKMYYMGMPRSGGSGWRLHHNKYFLVEYGATVEMAFGSANLSWNGVSVNFENWNFLKGKSSIPFIADHLCDIKAMRVARLAKADQDDPKVFRQELKQCLTYPDLKLEEVDSVLKRDGVIALFAPDKEDNIFAILKDQIDNVVREGRIRMAVYFFMHRPIIEALMSAQNRGVKVELLIDDDIQGATTSIATQKVFYNELIRPEVSGFDERVFDTNESIFQMQHNKFLVLEGVRKKDRTLVFAGAGQYTVSAFQNNYENFYLIETPSLVRQFSDLFESVWKLGAPVAAATP